MKRVIVEVPRDSILAINKIREVDGFQYCFDEYDNYKEVQNVCLAGDVLPDEYKWKPGQHPLHIPFDKFIDIVRALKKTVVL